MRYVSVFSGIEAATVAWEPLGWEPVAFAEVDPFPCAVLEKRWPHVPNLGDVCAVDWKEFVEDHGAVDVVVGGSPCQSFSIAGGREGLDGESRLMYEYIRAVREVRPRWFLWENVPGVFSTDAGRAFGILLDAMAELGYGLAWRVLDAQFFGVAQRRRRVFLVGHLGGVGGAAAVLFDAESVRGNTVPSREKRKELARAAEERPGVGGFKHNASATAGGVGFVNEQSPTLMAGQECSVMAFAQNTRDEVRIQGDGDMSGALSAQPGMKQTTYVLQSDGSTSRNSHGDGYQADGSAYTLNCIDRQSVVCMQTKDDVAPTINARHDSSPCDDRGQAVVCMESGQGKAVVTTDGQSPTLNAEHEQPIVCVADDNANAAIDEDMCGSLKVGGGSAVNSNGEEVTGALCARDFKGVGSQYVDEGKVICQRTS